MPEPLRIQGLLAKEESVYGTDPTPTAADNGVRIVGDIFNSITPEFVFPNRREDVVSNSLIKAPPATPRGRIMTFDITIELKGSGSAYASGTPVRPEIDPLLMACGMSRTHVDTGGSESVTYAMADTGHSSCTIWAYAAGKLFKVVGCRGSFTWDVTAGGLGRIRFQLQGMLSTAPTNVAVPAITYSSVESPAAVGIGLAVVPNGGSSWTPEVGAIEVMSGGDFQRLDDVNAADGIGGFFAPAESPIVRIPARVVDLSDFPAYATAASANYSTIDLTIGGTQYNRVDLDIDAAYLTNDPGHGEDNGFAAYDLEFECQDLALVFD